MASPGSVVIQFLVDAKNAARDTAKLATSFGKVEDSADDLDATLDALDSELDSIGRASKELSRDMDKAGVGFKSVGDDAEDAARRVRIAAREMADGVHDGGTKIDHETDGIKGSMKEAGSEAGAEFIGNMAEGIGSGTANVKEVVQGTLGGLTNLAASIGGPIGLAAGAAAAGIGIVYAQLTKKSEAAKAQIEGIVGALEDLKETASDTAKAQIWDAWVGSLEDGAKQMGQIATGLRDAGISQGIFQAAITGSADAQKEVADAVQVQIDKILEYRREHVTLSKAQQKRLDNLYLINDQLGIGNKALTDTKKFIADTELLTGDAAEASSEWAKQQHQVYKENLSTKLAADEAALKALKGQEHTKEWKAEQERLTDEVKRTKKALDDAAKDRDSNLTVHVKFVNKRGEPTNLTNAEGETRMAPAAMTMAAPPAYAPLPPMTVNVQLDQWGSARVVKRAGEAYDRRQGRKPGAPLARAW